MRQDARPAWTPPLLVTLTMHGRAELAGKGGAPRSCCWCGIKGLDILTVTQVNAKCEFCPEMAEVCAPERLKMPDGMTVDWRNLSIGIYCPNALACKGGSLVHLAATDNRTIRREVLQKMCAPGYTGNGCFECADGYGRADDAALRCARCPARSSLNLVRVMLFYASKDQGSSLPSHGQFLPAVLLVCC